MAVQERAALEEPRGLGGEMLPEMLVVSRRSQRPSGEEDQPVRAFAAAVPLPMAFGRG